MQRLGRYTLYAEIASGGMATVYFARLAGESGFTRTVAVKQLHTNLALDPEFAAMFVDEARLAARIRHPNVVPTIDVEQVDGTLFVVMDYVHGEPLSRLIRFVAGEVERIPFGIISAIMTNVLSGLHAAHELRDKHGAPIDLVHRDVSPQNVLVGADGVARVIDFGVAKARGRMVTTQDGKVKGKLAYMSPEQMRGERIDRRADVYAAGVVLWELLTLVRLFANKNEALTIENALWRRVEPPSAFAADVPPEVDAVVMRALARDPADRFDTAKQMATALEAAMPVASQAMVTEWVEATAHAALSQRSAILDDIERATTRMTPLPELAGTPTRPRRAARVWAAAVTAVVVAITAATVFHVARARPRAPVHADSSPAPLLTVVDTSVPEPTSSAPSAPTESAAPPPRSAVHMRTPPSRCSPPYTVGADGIRRYKIDCLQ